MRSEGKAGLYDFIKRAKTPKPEVKQPPKAEKPEQLGIEDIEASLRELGAMHNRAFEKLIELAEKKGGEPVSHLLTVRGYRTEREGLEERKKSGALSAEEKKRLAQVTQKLKGLDDIEIVGMFNKAHTALAAMVPDKRLRDPADVFPWLKIPKGQKQSPYDTHLKRISGTFDFKAAGLSDDEQEEMRAVAARMETAHRNDVFLRKLAGPYKENEIVKIHAERVAAEKEANAGSTNEQVSDRAAE